MKSTFSISLNLIVIELLLIYVLRSLCALPSFVFYLLVVLLLIDFISTIWSKVKQSVLTESVTEKTETSSVDDGEYTVTTKVTTKTNGDTTTSKSIKQIQRKES